MVIERKAVKFGHTDGHCDLSFSSDASIIMTCGTDGDVRIWKGYSDNDPFTSCVGAEFVRCVRQYKDHIYLSTEDCRVQILTFPNGERDGILTKFLAPVNHMFINHEKGFIAIAAEDMDVKLINLESKDIVTFDGLDAPPLSVALCPKVEMLAVSSGDEKLRIYSVETQSVIKEFKCVPKANCFMNAKSYARMSFEPIGGNQLAYPDKNMVTIVNTSTWETVNVLKCDDITEMFSIVEYSPCGKFLAGCSLAGDIVIWDVNTEIVVDVSRTAEKGRCTALCWNPTGNGELAYSNEFGHFGLLSNCYTQKKKNVDNTGSSRGKNVEGGEDNDSFEDDDFYNRVDDMGDDNLGVEFHGDDDDDDNENAVSIDKLKKQCMGGGESEQEIDSKKSPSPRPHSPDCPMQDSFMPTSSPEHLDPRYMCWNEVGVVRCYGSTQDADPETTRSSIEVEFHDSSFHSSMMMSDFNGYTMGSLSTSVLAIANNRQISIVPLSAGTREWKFSLKDCEDIVCIAASHNLICIATNANLVHISTAYGTQKALIAIPGPVVTMAAHGNYLLVAYHQASPRGMDQVIGILLGKFEGVSTECRDLRATLTPKSTLSWLGFSDRGSPAFLDSEGMLFLHPLQANIWMPFCDSKSQFASPSDTLFVTSVYESSATVRGIKCRSGIYPGFVPRPVLIELPLQSPFIEINTEKATLESNLFTWATLQVDDIDKKYKETALKTFALSCKSNQDQRALELIETLNNPQILALSVKYASKLDRKRLAEKLTELASQISNEPSDIFSNNYSEVSTPTNVLKPNKTINLTASKLTPKQRYGAKSTSSTPNITNEDLHSQDMFPSGISQIRSEEIVTTQDVTTPENAVKNPFLKSAKRTNPSYNPLSLTDKFAGIEEAIENKQANASAEKRKKPDIVSPPEKKDKQRKLDRFIFSKRT